ncbi:putative candidate secreted effector protein [Blumeria hordei DH14]|nr:putative candidate secreted effector protein [Blumeria hordei DH14]
MRLVETLTAVPLIFSVYVSAEHGYICSDAEGNANTTYNKAFVEESLCSRQRIVSGQTCGKRRGEKVSPGLGRLGRLWLQRDCFTLEISRK